MSDFDFLADQQVTQDDTAEMTLYSARLPNGKHPKLFGRFAGEANQAYTNAILKRNHAKAKGMRARAPLANDLTENRNQDRELYPKHVIFGWEDVCDAEAVDQKFSPEKCKEFFLKLPDDMFDEVRNFFADPFNFRDQIDPEEATAKGKK